ncbi:hypothetical protein QOZ80_9BG0700710 [Eleusine coracana subsp. coracana]|nr:hypothetical protein QOZ80_9BG0700710 [Eleusine coracana subsp. coracana]
MSSRWPDLPIDLLLDISLRFNTATDYVSFHAVCKPWRHTLPPPGRRPAFLPWLIAPRDATGDRKARCVFSSVSSPNSAAATTEVCIRDKRWVINADSGTATCWLVTDANEESASTHVEPLTGSAAAIPLPPCPADDRLRWEDRAVSSVDGTILLYDHGPINGLDYRDVSLDMLFQCPGDAAWTLMPGHGADIYWKDMEHCCIAYHKGKIVLCRNRSWRILPSQTWFHMGEERGKKFVSNHLMESQGELLHVFVHLHRGSAY